MRHSRLRGIASSPLNPNNSSTKNTLHPLLQFKMDSERPQRSNLPSEFIQHLCTFMAHHSDSLINFTEEISEMKGPGMISLEVDLSDGWQNADPSQMLPAFCAIDCLLGLYGPDYNGVYRSVYDSMNTTMTSDDPMSKHYYVMMSGAVGSANGERVSSTLYRIRRPMSMWDIVIPEEVGFMNDYDRGMSLKDYLLVKGIWERLEFQ